MTGLQLPSGIGDEHPRDGVEPVGLLQDARALPGLAIVVNGYNRVLDRLRSLGYRDEEGESANLLPVSYDWRLSHRWVGNWLGTVVEPALERWRRSGPDTQDARLVFVCFGTGGLAVRWYVERCGGAEITAKVITVGTPYRGTVYTLERLANGIHIMGGRSISRAYTNVFRSMPAFYQQLPEYACVETGDDLARITEVSVPNVDPAMMADAMAFHGALLDAERARPASLDATSFIAGTGLPTPATVRIEDDRVIALETYRGQDLSGDSVVPLFSACSPGVPLDSNRILRVRERQSHLHRNPMVLDLLESIITAQPVMVR